MHCAKKSHEDAIKQICQYLHGTKNCGLIFTPTGQFTVDCFVDADFAGLWTFEDDQDPVSIKSRTGYVLMFGRCPLLWMSKLLTEIALSTLEAEYIALSQSMQGVIPTKTLVEELLLNLGVSLQDVSTHSTIFKDNSGALTLANSPKMTPQSKQIGIKYHFFHEHIKWQMFKIVCVSSDLQKADLFIKGLAVPKFQTMRKRLVVHIVQI